MFNFTIMVRKKSEKNQIKKSKQKNMKQKSKQKIRKKSKQKIKKQKEIRNMHGKIKKLFPWVLWPVGFIEG